VRGSRRSGGHSAGHSATTKPPVTAADRAWVAGVAKLRQRLDRVFLQSGVILTQAKVREYIRTGRSCTPRPGPARPPDGAAATARCYRRPRLPCRSGAARLNRPLPSPTG